MTRSRVALHLVKTSGISGSLVNGTRFFGSSRWKIPEKVENLKGGPVFPVGIVRTVQKRIKTCCNLCTELGPPVKGNQRLLGASSWMN